MMKKFNVSLVALALASTGAFAKTTAIINADIHTATDKGVVKSASILIEDGKIKAISNDPLTADEVIDAKGKIVTPGFIGSMNSLGLVEVGAVASSRDSSDKKGVTFDPSLAFNPRTTLIPYARKGGITRDVIAPSHGDGIFAGLSATVNLTGELGNSVVDAKNGVVVDLGAKSKGSRAASLQSLIETLEKHQDKLAEKEDSKETKDKKAKKPAKLSAEEEIFKAVLAGEKPLVISVSRAQDMLELLNVKKQFGLDMVFVGADDAVIIKEQLAATNTPVIISAMSNLPTSFDSLNAALTNAGELEKAGVKVALTITGDSSHNLYQLRYDAGNAVSYGMSHQGALAAITSNVADIFNIEDAGSIEVGKAADLVMWSADPFEISTQLEKIWINGVEVSTESRHDKLRDRYMADSDLPRAYVK